MKKELVITPRTKILDLLDAYPELEEKLIAEIPAFEKLKNPILRKTIARMTSIQQAAAVGKVPLAKIIQILRDATGQKIMAIERMLEDHSEQKELVKPVWYETHRIRKTLDARPILERGEHPVTEVMSELQQTATGEIYHLITSFFPAPLIEKAQSIGFEHFTIEEASSIFHIYFSKSDGRS